MREVFNKDAYDYLVIGSGVAGLFTALKAAEAGRKVALVTKAHLEESNTRYAQGGIAAAIAPTDSPALHIEDTLIAGAGLCDREAVEILCREAPARIAALLEVGVPFDRKQDEISLGREGAHSANRILHAGGDATGFHIEISLCRAVKTHPNVTVFEQTFVEELILEGEQVAGAQLRDAAGQPFELRALVTVLASGGAGQLYTYTTNPEVATGDGLALAYRAGAALADLEFYQFHPTALVLPGAPTFLVSEAVRGEGATLRRVNPDGSAGVAFMTEYDPRGDLASRDIVSRAITSEMTKTGQAFVYLDATHLPAEVLRERFPTIDRFCRDHGLDFTVQPLPVAPAAHYFMGGVATDSWGATSVAGLFACGEVACTGVHGANRLASNSLLEGLVFGQRIVEKVEALRNKASAEDVLDLLAEQAGQVKRRFGTTDFVRAEVAPVVSRIARRSEVPTLAQFQAKMWQAVGLVRDDEGLTEAKGVLADWAETTEKAAELARQRPDLTQDERRQILELTNLTLLGRLMAQAAKVRTESRGGHFRRDFPTTHEEWQRRIVLTQPLKVLA